MINFKQLLEKAAADNNKVRTLPSSAAKVSTDTTKSPAKTPSQVVNLKHIQSTRQTPFVAGDPESPDPVDPEEESGSGEESSGESSDANAAAKIASVRIRPNAEFLTRYVGSRERLNLKVDSATAPIAKEDVELTLFRRKGENVLRRIAKYYGFSIEITGQEEQPEGYIAEIGAHGNRIAAGNEGVVAVLRGYWEEQQQPSQCTSESSIKDSKAARKRAKLQSKKLSQQHQITQQTTVEPRSKIGTIAETASVVPDATSRTVCIPESAKASPTVSQFKIGSKKKQIADGVSDSSTSDLKISPGSASTKDHSIASSATATPGNSKSRMIKLFSTPSPTSAPTAPKSDEKDQKVSSVLGKRTAFTASTNGAVPVSHPPSAEIADESNAGGEIKAPDLTARKGPAANAKSPGQNLARRAFLSIKAQV